jgi:hypothetical protein
MMMKSLNNLFKFSMFLSYGLCNLPLSLWQECDHPSHLEYLLMRAECVRSEYRAARVKF